MTYQNSNNRYNNVNDQDYTKAPGEAEDEIDEIGGTDLKINPDYYIHTAILKAQQSLVKENVKEGFLQYTVMTEHIESLCRASNMLDDEYKTKLAAFIAGLTDTDVVAKNVKIANMKIELMLTAVFNKKTMRDKLKA